MLIVTHAVSVAANSDPAINETFRCTLDALLFHDRFNVFLRDALQARDKLAPIDRAIVADDRNRRYSTAFYDDVALRRTLDAVHVADAVFEPAREPQPFVPELLEKAQEAALDRHRGTRAAERRNVLDCALADLPRVFSGTAFDVRVELRWLPSLELEPFHVRVDTACDRAEI